MKDIRTDYYDWVCSLIIDEPHRNFSKLLSYLYDKEFTYIINRDYNRAADGINLRYLYAYYHEVPDRVMDELFYKEPCSVLEMMVALCRRVEDIMSTERYGDRTAYWFWEMINNLGIGTMNDLNFSERIVSEIIDDFLNRDYERDGRGGLVTIRDRREDLRTVEIWYQIMWKLNEYR